MDEPGVRSMGCSFNDQRKETESGIAVAEAGAGSKIESVVLTEEVKDVVVEDLGCLAGGDEVFVVGDAGGVGEEVADQDFLADVFGEFGEPVADGIVEG